MDIESESHALPEPVPGDSGDGLEAHRGAEGCHREDGRLHRSHPPHLLQRTGLHRPHGRTKTEGWVNEFSLIYLHKIFTVQ